MDTQISAVDKIVADYLLAVETGVVTNLDTLCDQHPEYVDEIRSYFELQGGVFDSFQDREQAADFKIDGFEIVSEIGRGGMGIVFEAVQSNLNRSVAIKVLKEGALASEAGRKRFEDEAKLIAQFQHKHIVDVIQYGTVAGRPFLVMPLTQGRSLNRMIQKGPLPQKSVAKVMLQVTDAISAAHEMGVIHRDIKPANILGNSTLDDCKVTDFGLAVWDDSEERFTKTGDIVGTPGYMAPEIIWGKSKGDKLTDVYSIGATMYALLTGVPPFRAATPAESILLAMAGDPVTPRKLNQNLAVDIESICLKCMHPTRSRRYVSVVEIGDDLKRFVNQKPVAARPVGKLEMATRWARRNRGLAGAIAAALVLLMGIVGLGTYSYFEISKSNSELKTSLDLQAELTDNANASLAGSISAIENFFIKVGASSVLSDTEAAAELKQELLDDGIGFLNEFLAQNKDKPELRLQVGESYLTLSRLHSRLSNDDEGRNAANQAVKFLSGVYEENPTDVSVARSYSIALTGAAGYNMRPKGIEGVTPLYEESIKVSKVVYAAIENGEHKEVKDADVHFRARFNFWKQLYETGVLDESIVAATQVTDEMKAFLDKHPDEPDLHIALAKKLNNLGVMNHKLGRSEIASKQYEMTCKYARAALALVPKNEGAMKQLTYGLGNLSHALQSNLVNAKGIDGLDEADIEMLLGMKAETISIAKALMNRHPANFRHRMNYIKAVSNCGAGTSNFDIEKAQPYFDLSVKLLEQELKLHPQESDPDDWYELALIKKSYLFTQVGIHERLGNLDEVFKYLNETTVLSKLIWSVMPYSEKLRVQHMNELINFGRKFQAAGRFEEAFELHTLSFNINRELESLEFSEVLLSRIASVLDSEDENSLADQEWPLEFRTAVRDAYLAVDSRIKGFEANNESVDSLLELKGLLIKRFRQLGKASFTEPN